jgi:hypothetical protein
VKKFWETSRWTTEYGLRDEWKREEIGRWLLLLHCYNTPNFADLQAQLLLGQPGRCLQVLRSHPRRVSLFLSSYISVGTVWEREVGRDRGRWAVLRWASLFIIGDVVSATRIKVEYGVGYLSSSYFGMT